MDETGKETDGNSHAFGFILILALWATSEWNKIDVTVVALTGVSIMLLTGVIR